MDFGATARVIVRMVIRKMKANKCLHYDVNSFQPQGLGFVLQSGLVLG